MSWILSGATRRRRLRFDSWIANLGTSSGTRIVLGHRQRSPSGPFSDVMLVRPDGERLPLSARAAQRAATVGDTRPGCPDRGKRAMNHKPAKQFFELEGHLRVPRKHVETIVVSSDGSGGSGESQEVRDVVRGGRSTSR